MTRPVAAFRAAVASLLVLSLFAPRVRSEVIPPERHIDALTAYRMGLEATSQHESSRAVFFFEKSQRFGAPTEAVRVRIAQARFLEGESLPLDLLVAEGAGAYLRSLLRIVRATRGQYGALAGDLEASASRGGPYAASDLLEASDLRARVGDTAALLADLRLLIGAYPESPEAYPACLRLEALRSARTRFVDATHPYDALLEARIFLAARDPRGAIARLSPFEDRAVPSTLRDDLLLALGRAYYYASEYDTAASHLRRLRIDFAGSPAAAEAEGLLLSIAVATGDTGMIRRLYPRLWDDELALTAARFARARGAPDEALHILTNRPRISAPILFEAALASLDTGDTAAARSRLQATAAQFPRSGEAGWATLLRADLEASEGRSGSARDLLRALLAESFDAFTVLSARERLRALGAAEGDTFERELLGVRAEGPNLRLLLLGYDAPRPARPDWIARARAEAETTLAQMPHHPAFEAAEFLFEAGDTVLGLALLDRAAAALDPRAVRERIRIARGRGETARALALARGLVAAAGLPEIPEVVPRDLAQALFPPSIAPPPFLWSVARAASGFDPLRIAGRKIGLFGIDPSDLPETVPTVALFEPARNLEWGARLLGAAGEGLPPNRIDLLAAGYHAGRGNLIAWRIPALPPETALWRIPFPQTRDFIREVLAGVLALEGREE